MIPTSRYAGRFTVGALALTASWLVTACGSETSIPYTVTSRDLTADFSRATIHREIAHLDFGRPTARSHLSQGWSWDERDGERTFVWSVGPSSVLEFHLAAPRELTTTLSGFAFRFPGAPPQRVTVEVNDHPVARFEAGAESADHRFVIPKDVLDAGRNEMVLRYAWHHRPAEVTRSRDRRPLAVAWERLRFDGLLDAAAPRARPNADPPRLFVPFGSQVSYHLELAGTGAAARLSAGGIRQRGRGRLEVIWQAGGVGPETASEALGPGNASTGEWFGPDAAADARPVRLTLRAVAASGSTALPGADRGILLEAPVLQLRHPPRRTAAATLQAARPEKRLNVILYLVDTLRADRLGAYGGPSPSPSPRLDRFAAEGVLFERTVAQTSWTKPAVASILTGLGPILHGVNDPRDALAPRAITLAEILTEAGYRAAGFVTNAHLTAASGLAQGFEHWDYRFDVPAHELHEPAMAWIDRQIDRLDGEPFFLYLHTIDPHAPYMPLPAYRERFAPAVTDLTIGTVEHIRSLPGTGPPAKDPATAALLALYDAEVAQNDAAFGELLDALVERDLDEETIVIFLSDHGEAFREHGVLGHGWDLYGETLSVPWVMRWPGAPAGLRIQEAAQHADFVPTLLALLGLEAPAGLDGRDLTPLLAGSDIAPVPIFSYLDYEGRRGMSVVYRGLKLIEPLGGSFAGQRELYRLLGDPAESDDRARGRPIWTGYLASLARGELLRKSRGLEARRDVIDETRRRELEALGYLR